MTQICYRCQMCDPELYQPRCLYIESDDPRVSECHCAIVEDHRRRAPKCPLTISPKSNQNSIASDFLLRMVQ